MKYELPQFPFSFVTLTKKGTITEIMQNEVTSQPTSESRVRSVVTPKGSSSTPPKETASKLSLAILGPFNIEK